MDWKKTKNILIIALIIMNTLLIYNIYFRDAGNKESIDDFNSVKILMTDRNININKIEYKSYELMPKFLVGKMKYELSLLSELENQNLVISDNNGVLNIYYDITENGDINVEELENSIIKTFNIANNDMKLMYNQEIFDKNIKLYNQMYGNNIFDDGFIRIEYLENQYLLVEYQWLDIVKTDENYQGEIYPIEKSILSLIDLQDKINNSIEIINYEIIYHVDEKEELIIDGISKNEPRIYWQAITNYGTKYYYNGLR